MNRFNLTIIFLTNYIITYAVDPSGVRVDYDDHSSDTGFIFFVIIGIIIALVYVLYIIYTSPKSSNQSKSNNPKKIEMYSREWFELQKKKEKETNAGCWAFIITLAIFIIAALLNS